MTEQVPSVGRIVHFVYGSEHYAALITAVDFHVPDPVGGVDMVGEALTVFPPNEPSFTIVAAHDAKKAGGTWHWPEYVPAKERQ